MQSVSVCCSQRLLLNLHPPPPPAACTATPLFNRCHSLSPLHPSHHNSGWRTGGICLRRRFGAARVTSYLPDSDTPAAVVQETPPSLTAGGSVQSSWSGGLEAYCGKPGAVSFCGLSYRTVEGRTLVNSPFKEGTGSFLWVLAPVALLSSLLLPQFFLGGVVEGFVRDEILSEIVVSFVSEFIFYAGLASFLSTTDHVQRPYLEFSSKRWSLITGLRGYLSSAFFIMGFKVFAPLMTAYVVWPVVGLPALIAVVPFLLGCAAQYAFELYLEKRSSSCWPLLPIIFEMYRVYQLSKASHFIEMLMFSLKESPMSPLVMERSGALISMLFVLQILGVVCLWSLTTFLLRLFPSRPVAENY